MEGIGTNRNSNWFSRLLRLLTLRRVDDLAAMASDASVAGCAALALALWVIADRLQWGRGVEFDSLGLRLARSQAIGLNTVAAVSTVMW